VGVGGVYVPWDAVDVVWSLTVAGMCCVAGAQLGIMRRCREESRTAQ